MNRKRKELLFYIPHQSVVSRIAASSIEIHFVAMRHVNRLDSIVEQTLNNKRRPFSFFFAFILCSNSIYSRLDLFFSLSLSLFIIACFVSFCSHCSYDMTDRNYKSRLHEIVPTTRFGQGLMIFPIEEEISIIISPRFSLTFLPETTQETR